MIPKVMKSRIVRTIKLFALLSLIFVVLFMFFSIEIKSSQKINPFAFKGLLDLTKWDFDKQGTVRRGGSRKAQPEAGRKPFADRFCWQEVGKPD